LSLKLLLLLFEKCKMKLKENLRRIRMKSKQNLWKKIFFSASSALLFSSFYWDNEHSPVLADELEIELHSDETNDLVNFGDPLVHIESEEDLIGEMIESQMQNTMASTSSSVLTSVERIEGQNRLRVAENISRRGWSRSQTVVIANGFEFTDALSGSPLAAHYNAPMLLVDHNGISSETLAEIARLNATQAIILGGTASVPQSVESALSQRGISVQRIGGQNRYDTSRMIAEELISLRGHSTAHLVNGYAFADAVSISSVAGRYKQPILLTPANELHPEVRKIAEIVKDWRIIGGPNSISQNTEAQLSRLADRATRLSGQDRYEVNQRVLNNWGIQSNHLYIGSGEAFADVLAGSVLAASENTGVLLASNHLNTLQRSERYARNRGIESFFLLGGERTLNPQVKSTFEQLYRTVERVHVNGIYTVRQGDNFRRIAEGFGMTTLQLEQYNPQITNTNQISIGQKIAVTRQGVESMLSASERSRLVGSNNPSQFNNAQHFVDWMAPRAQAVSRQQGEEALYPSLMIAQAMHESGVARSIGESQLARPPHYNLFGIKARNNQAYTLHWTWEHINGQDLDVLARFRSFSSYDESLQEYANLLRYGRGTGEDFYYRGTWRRNTSDVWQVLRDGGLRGYATDPAYFTAIENYIRQYNLTQYD
jgi:flagellum-specific peptidoglycan hydrolase FlgJ